MPNNYQFLDANSSILTAHSSITTGGAHEPYVIISSILSMPSSPPSSVSGTVGASIIGQLPGGVALLGSVISFQGGGWSPSAMGYRYRNDTLASTLGADQTFGPSSRDSAGRTLIKPYAAEEARIEGYNSVVSTSVTTLIAAAGTGLRNYITDIWFANSDSTNGTVVTLKDGAGSILGYTYAPSKSGSNLPGLVTPIRTGINTTFDFQAGTGVSILYATVKGFKAP